MHHIIKYKYVIHHIIKYKHVILYHIHMQSRQIKYKYVILSRGWQSRVYYLITKSTLFMITKGMFLKGVIKQSLIKEYDNQEYVIYDIKEYVLLHIF